MRAGFVCVCVKAGWCGYIKLSERRGVSEP